MAELLANLDPSVYVLDCSWNMTPDLVSARIEPFVKTPRRSAREIAHLARRGPGASERLPNGKRDHPASDPPEVDGRGRETYFSPTRECSATTRRARSTVATPTDLGMMRQAEVFSWARQPRCWRNTNNRGRGSSLFARRMRAEACGSCTARDSLGRVVACSYCCRRQRPGTCSAHACDRPARRRWRTRRPSMFSRRPRKCKSASSQA